MGEHDCCKTHNKKEKEHAGGSHAHKNDEHTHDSAEKRIDSSRGTFPYFLGLAAVFLLVLNVVQFVQAGDIMDTMQGIQTNNAILLADTTDSTSGYPSTGTAEAPPSAMVGGC